jgi:prophage antirepressor-like protein
MTQTTAIKLFENKNVRSVWDNEQEKWYISIVDVIEVLTGSSNPRNYWKVLKHRLRAEGNESVTNCNQLKMQSSDGKFYKTDVADVEQLFRLIQSIPSPKAEPFKLWLAQIARQGGQIAGNTRREIEAKTGKRIISPANAKELK